MHGAESVFSLRLKSVANHPGDRELVLEILRLPDLLLGRTSTLITGGCVENSEELGTH